MDQVLFKGWLAEAKKPSGEQQEFFRGRDLLGIKDLSKENIETILTTAAYYEAALLKKERLYDMDGRIMASLFFEPSTRTRLSFEAAMHRLGGSVVTVAESPSFQISSTAKGETLADSIRVIDGYVDIIVCRHPMRGASVVAAANSEIPVINGGDGTGEHPTQALLDLYTIFREKGSPAGKTFALVGDLKNGRTVHSLVDILCMYDCKLVFCSPNELAMPDEIVNRLLEKGICVDVTDDINQVCKKADVIYMTRVQGERFFDQEEYYRVKDSFLLDEQHLTMMKSDVVLMHPLPRLNEISEKLDDYPGSAYFRQSANGIYIRMALLALLTGCVK